MTVSQNKHFSGWCLMSRARSRLCHKNVVKPPKNAWVVWICQYPWGSWTWVCFILGFVTHLYDLFLWEGECQVFLFVCISRKHHHLKLYGILQHFFAQKNRRFPRPRHNVFFPFPWSSRRRNQMSSIVGRDDEVVEVRCGSALAFYRYVYIYIPGKL